MTTRETAITFACAAQRLLGIVSWPASDGAAAQAGLGMVIVVGGPQYRAGSHRQFVHLARAAAAAGLPTLRFDCRGMGDSEGEQREFDEMDEDIAAAIDALLREAPSVRQVILCALCDGASASLLYLRRRGPDERVAALALMNPWTRTLASQAETRVRHYYLERLGNPQFWRKLIRGGVGFGALGEALASVRAALGGTRGAPAARPAATAAAPNHFLALMAEGVQRFRGALLIVTSGRDYTAKEFLLNCQRDARWREVMSRASTTHVEIASADHTFSTRSDERELLRHIVAWISTLPVRAALAAGVRR